MKVLKMQVRCTYLSNKKGLYGYHLFSKTGTFDVTNPKYSRCNIL